MSGNPDNVLGNELTTRIRDWLTTREALKRLDPAIHADQAWRNNHDDAVYILGRIAELFEIEPEEVK